MIQKIGDIDIDCRSRDDILEIINHVPASIIRDGYIEKHNTGVYVQHIPVDPITGLCSIDYKTAEELGYFKLDLLNLNVYKDVKDEAHLKRLMAKEPLWELLEHKEVVEGLYQLSNHFAIVEQMKPCSVEHLAMVLALIRPGKRYLIGKNWEDIEKDIWVKDDSDKYVYKRAHAISYAHVIVLQMNLLTERA